MRSLIQVLCFFTVVLARAGEFKNLTFDEPITNRTRPVFLYGRLLFQGDANRLIPGWSITYDKSIASSVYFSDNTGGDGITLVQNIPRLQDLYGQFSLGVYGFKYIKDAEPVPISIELSQTGMIPEWVVGIRYFSGDLRFQLLVNGEPVGNGYGYADLTQFAGSEVTMQLRFPPRYTGNFDIIGFTTVPEPSEYHMFGVGLGLLGWQARKRRGGRGFTHAPSTSADPK